MPRQILMRRLFVQFLSTKKDGGELCFVFFVATNGKQYVKEGIQLVHMSGMPVTRLGRFAYLQQGFSPDISDAQSGEFITPGMQIKGFEPRMLVIGKVKDRNELMVSSDPKHWEVLKGGENV